MIHMKLTRKGHFAGKVCLASVLEALYIENISCYLLTFQNNMVRHQNISGHMEESNIESTVKSLENA